jgi:hypothetical protein
VLGKGKLPKGGKWRPCTHQRKGGDRKWIAGKVVVVFIVRRADMSG